MGYRIVADSSCDIWKLGNADFKTAALTISTDERTFKDDETIVPRMYQTFLGRALAAPIWETSASGRYNMRLLMRILYHECK
jgi:hypothetical protein